MKWSALLGYSLLCFGSAATAQCPATLFADDTMLRLSLQGPIAAFAANRATDNIRPAVLIAGTETLPITVRPRGLTRRSPDICDFPPLRIDFSSPPAAGSLFEGQRRLKLVTHCKRSPAHQQHLLLEYAAYRLYNLLTPLSFRARLATIDYRDASGRPMVSRFGFFIEDLEDVARRNGLSMARTADRIEASQLSRTDAARAALFAYMIGNLDWSMRAGPEGDGCCHNFRLLAKAGSPSLIPVPYDFDFAGLVDAPYATPPDRIPVANARVRRYRGYCAHEPEALAAAAAIRDRQPALLAIVAATPGLEPRTAAKATAYLRTFFAQISDDASVRTKVLTGCVR